MTILKKGRAGYIGSHIVHELLDAGECGGRRPGDLPQIVASIDRTRALLCWRPRVDDLTHPVSHAIAWERKLQARRLTTC